MSDFVTGYDAEMTPIIPVLTDEYSDWIKQQSTIVQNWLATNNFKAKSADTCLFPNAEGQIKQLYVGIESKDDFWAFAGLPNLLATGIYKIAGEFTVPQQERIAIAWSLGKYKFNRYKKSTISQAVLALSEGCNLEYIGSLSSSIALGKEIINTPAEAMTPQDLAKTCEEQAKEFAAQICVIRGDELLTHGFNAIHLVGRSSSNEPCLIDMRWGEKQHKKVVLVGKGICFDSGGLDIKTAEGMQLMKKDMSGAAFCLALARMIMIAKLPINLRVLIPAAENMISANCYKPGDIVTTYNGKTVEVTNTDAEGRMVLADALAYACDEQPDLIIDFASLTGAARVALGLDITAMFADDEQLAHKILFYARQEDDPIWLLPCYKPYKTLLASDNADLKNSASSRWGGAITGALFLQEFVAKGVPWVHFDCANYSDKDRPGRPHGGEIIGVRAVFNYLRNLV